MVRCRRAKDDECSPRKLSRRDASIIGFVQADLPEWPYPTGTRRQATDSSTDVQPSRLFRLSAENISSGIFGFSPRLFLFRKRATGAPHRSQSACEANMPRLMATALFRFLISFRQMSHW